MNDISNPYTSVSKRIRDRVVASGARFFANDNISEYIADGEEAELIDELSDKFQSVLESMIIDIDNDPNSSGTGRRLAKMYVKEIFAGRYQSPPAVTAFPNEGPDAYDGMLVVHSEIRSVCSHHHQPVVGNCYIGIIPGEKVIGLSKYTRIAQHCARRGTLQEELGMDICKAIQEAAGTEDVAVYISAEHGCCTNRGIMAKDSTTQTSVVRGKFRDKFEVRQELFDQIKMRQTGRI